MNDYKSLLSDALKLKPVERVHLGEGLMASLEKPDPEIEAMWEQESLDRYEAYNKKLIKVRDLDDVLKKYE